MIRLVRLQSLMGALLFAAALFTVSSPAFAQGTPKTKAPAADKDDDDGDKDEPGDKDKQDGGRHEEMGDSGLVIHFVSTQGTYAPIEYDVYNVETQKLVISGIGADEARGESPVRHSLKPGLYKVVKNGQPFNTRTDFATLVVEDGVVNDFVIMVDLQSGAFRGAGPVTDELPEGLDVFGVRLALNGGGSLLLNHKVNPIGRTAGVTALIGLFGHFGLTWDQDRHFLDVSSDLQLNITDSPTGKPFSTSDQFDGSATYTFKLNKYFGPYVRGGFRTRVFPGYLYLKSDTPLVAVTRFQANGTQFTESFGGEANPDSIRIKLSEVFSPFILQEEIGANLKAVDLDLFLVKVVVGTRLGFGFRQGIVDNLFVVDGQETGPQVNLLEVTNYDTIGPVVGASAKVTLLRWLFGSANFNMMAPLNDKDRAGDNFGKRLLYDFTGTAGVKIPSFTDLLFASFDYSFRIEHDGFITRQTQFDQTLMARVNVTLF